MLSFFKSCALKSCALTTFLVTLKRTVFKSFPAQSALIIYLTISWFILRKRVETVLLRITTQQIYSTQNYLSEKTISSELNPNAASFETNNVNISQNTQCVEAIHKQNFKDYAISSELFLAFNIACMNFCRLQISIF